MKKKAGLKAEDEVFIFYHFDENSENLHKAITTQLEAIRYAVKKPIFPANQKANFVHAGKDEGEISGEKYEIYITYPHFIIHEEVLKVIFTFMIGLIRRKG